MAGMRRRPDIFLGILKCRRKMKLKKDEKRKHCVTIWKGNAVWKRVWEDVGQGRQRHSGNKKRRARGAGMFFYIQVKKAGHVTEST